MRLYSSLCTVHSKMSAFPLLQLSVQCGAGISTRQGEPSLGQGVGSTGSQGCLFPSPFHQLLPIYLVVIRLGGGILGVWAEGDLGTRSVFLANRRWKMPGMST